MITTQQAIREIIETNELISYGFSHNLFNFTQLAKFIQPLVVAKIKKDISTAAVLMALSRFKKVNEKGSSYHEIHLKISNISVNSNLSTRSFHKRTKIHKQLLEFHDMIQKENGYINMTEGQHEIGVIFDSRFIALLPQEYQEHEKYARDNISAIGIVLREEDVEFPGLLYSVLQKIVLQNINIVEVLSTYTEFILYVDKKDTTLVFDTIFECFQRKN